ncbi:hypothetical protein BX589_102333 [Paraburkholderia fungorum]|uniref:hypothetical protein n=1 Tax=Paraburkholderia fungorum TaxID=134537 RepID=UPI000D069958|nr:hypothetical protein [Paraburkholderia fungorum]PRZ56132.1 hypothetical protein BX589_102333 [Paraburkholderia fungorum]
MKERPILFSGPMVRALLDGSKTQTRRILKVQPDMSTLKPEFRDPNLWEFRKRFMMYADDWSGHEHAMYRKTERGDPDLPVYQHRSPFGEPGDRLWVRETWHAHWGPTTPGARIVTEAAVRQSDGAIVHASASEPLSVHYAADSKGTAPFGRKWKPSIHMPRWASRITLEVAGVRIERLQDISEADARNEGAVHGPLLPMGWDKPGCDPQDGAMRSRFAVLWDSLATPGADWDANPWVWVIEFKRVI